MIARVKQRTDISTNRDSDKIIVRLPEGMRGRIAERAAVNGRSMTAEVADAIEQHLAGSDRLTEISNFIEKHRSAIEGLNR